MVSRPCGLKAKALRPYPTSRRDAVRGRDPELLQGWMPFARGTGYSEAHTEESCKAPSVRGLRKGLCATCPTAASLLIDRGCQPYWEHAYWMRFVGSP